MEVVDAPEWLVPSFARSVAAAGGTATTDEVCAAARRLLARWSGRRRFHRVRHLADVLARVDELGPEVHEPALVRLAVWYHGALLDAQLLTGSHGAGPDGDGEDETASADAAVAGLSALGVPAPRAHRVGALVMVLAGHDPDPADTDAAVLCDADLGVLAVEPQKYRTYVRTVREEHADVPDADFLTARRTIVTDLLARRAIYRSPGAGPWEEAARGNLQAELHRLDRELATLPEPATVPSQAAPPVP